uniref:RNA-directed DNA polymerase n=1 Tax=Schizaphis graminum TaxID=13262 RepID=A0A2S2NNZ3_SCHGA
MIREQTEQNLSGITGHTLHSFGTTNLTLCLGKDERTTEFHVAPSSFPVPYDGILGKPFIIGLQTILNYKTKQLILTDNQNPSNLVNPTERPKTSNSVDNSETQNSTENLQSKAFKITLQPRSETIISIPTPNLQEEEIYLVPAQTLGESILCSNTVNQVCQKQILIAAVNPTEQSVQLTEEQIKGLKFENFTEVKVQTIQKVTETVGTKGRLVTLRDSLDTKHLNIEERESLVSTCEQYSDIFHLEGDPLTCTDAVFHEVNTPGTTQPINERPYRLPHRHKDEINRQMKQLEEDNIIAPSRSPWNAPLLVVPKKADKDGVVKYRVCVDFRKLNQISVGDAYPLPNIIDILDQLGKSKYYTTLDLAQGYHQVRMHPEHTEKTAFSTDKGHFEFLRVPFGLKGAPATFQRLMNTVLAGLTGLKAFVYLDDIIIYALSIADHSEKLKAVFERLRTFNLKLQPSKCTFMRKEVNYLGHVITDQGVKPNPQKIKCVIEFPIPTDEKKVKSFLGLSGYYRRFVPGYGRIAKPLTTLLKKDVIFKWTDLCQEAFDTLKKILTTEPLLQYPDFTRPFNLTCDASNYAIGCVLSQGPIGADPPIAYASRTLNRAESNYNTTEKELCAIVWGVKQFRPYLFGQKFNIVTDHQALNWLFNIKDPGSRLTRWRLKLAEYEYEIHFKPGASNTNADALSRINRVVTRSSKSPNSTESPDNTEPPTSTEHSSSTEHLSSYQKFLKEKVAFTPNVVESKGDIFETDHSMALAHCVSSDLKMTKGIALEFRRRFGGLNQLRRLPRTVSDVLSLRLKEREIFYLVTKQHFWQKPEPEHLFQSLQKLRTLCEEREIKTLTCPRLGTGLDGLQWETVRSMLQYIFRNSQVTIHVLVPETLSEKDQLQIIREFHENPMGGHQGTTRTHQRISQHHNWKGMRKQIKKYIRECATCQKNKSSNRTAREPMIITTTASRPFEKIYMDIVGPLTKSYNGNVFILTLQDDLSKFAWAAPMPNHEANTVAKFFVTQFVCLHGLPQSLVTDCGTEFLSKVFKEVCQLLKIKQTSTSPYHPQSNGSLERSHRTLAEYLRSFVNKDPQNWDTHVPFAMFCHNSTTHTSTKYQPYQLVYGYPITVPNSFMKNTEPQYNYDDYYFELKRNMQESQAQAKTHLYDSKQKSKDRYDQKISPLTINIGDKVLIQEKASKGKLAPKWIGPYTVIETNPESPNITILKKSRPVILHRNLLKKFYEEN